MRAYPPHAIRSDGVGPYLLDAPLADVLHLLPGGPRVELLQLGRLANWRVVRAENGQLLIGADPHNRVAFIAVLAREVARTESGLGVGTKGSDLLRALGRERDGHELARDRRAYQFASLPRVTWITDAPIEAIGDPARVVAVVVRRDPQNPDARASVPSTVDSAQGRMPSPAVPAQAPVPTDGIVSPGGQLSATRRGPAALGGAPGLVRNAGAMSAPAPDAGAFVPPRTDGADPRSQLRTACRAGEPLAAVRDEIVAVATKGRIGDRSAVSAALPLVQYGCVTGGAPEAVTLAASELAIVGGEPGRLRRLFLLPVDQATFVSLVDVDEDGRDEIVLGFERRDRDRHAVELRVLRWEGGRLLLLAQGAPIVVTAAEASAAGATPEALEFMVELEPARGGLAVGGLFAVRQGDALVTVAPILPTRLRFGRPARRGSFWRDRTSPPAGPDAPEDLTAPAEPSEAHDPSISDESVP